MPPISHDRIDFSQLGMQNIGRLFKYRKRLTVLVDIQLRLI
jgi:hypothetical protein